MTNNDKELIERLLCEAQATCIGSLEQTMYVVSRYLAERGKEASAYGVMWKIGDGSEVLQFPLATTEGEAKSDLSMYSKGDQENMRIVPLFLAPPAIPEGMALVPTSEKASIDVLEKFIGGGLYCGKFPYQELIDKARLKYAKFIAAAGEKP